MKINIVAIREQPDGSMLCDMDYDSDFEAEVCRLYNVEKITQEIISEFVVSALDAYIDAHDSSSDNHSKKESDEEAG